MIGSLVRSGFDFGAANASMALLIGRMRAHSVSRVIRVKGGALNCMRILNAQLFTSCNFQFVLEVRK